MKLLAFLVIVVAICWYFLTAGRPVAPNQVAVAPAPVVVPSVRPTPPPAPLPAAQAPTVSLVAAAKPVEAVNPAEAPQIVLENVLGPNNQYHDDLMGLSATFPEGWEVMKALRWGTNNHENTVFLKPDVPTSATPSMYYRLYVDPPPAADMAETYLLTQAQQKEDARIASGRADYKNVPESFAYTDINGSPALSYFATFTQGDQVMTEYFIRVLTPKGYVLFFTTGQLEDVKAIIPQVKQMASSLKGP